MVVSKGDFVETLIERGTRKPDVTLYTPVVCVVAFSRNRRECTDLFWVFGCQMS